MEHALILSIIGIALLLFAFEVFRPDVVGIMVLLALLLTGTLSVQEGFAGFSNPAVITVICMFILSAGLVRTGVADWVAKAVLKFGGNSPVLLTIGTMLAVGGMSAFMNNIGAVAVLLPVMFAVSQRSGYPVTKLLIPLSFGSLLGGLVTLIGTPPNLLVSTALEEAGYRGFTLFDYTPTGLAIFAVGVAYMVLIGRHLIPVREADNGDNAQRTDAYLSHLEVAEGSALIGRTLTDINADVGLGLRILHQHRDGIAGDPQEVLQAGDRLVVEAGSKELLHARDTGEVMIHARDVVVPAEIASPDSAIADVVVAPHSPLIGKRLDALDFPQRYGVFCMALRRPNRSIRDDYRALPLQVGDVLLVQGLPTAVDALTQSADFVLVQRMDRQTRDKRRAPLALGIMAMAILAAATGVLHISVAGLLGVLLMLVTGCVPVREMYNAVEWRVIFLIACMIPLGTAMDADHTGTAQWLADMIVGVAGDGSPLLVMVALYLFTTLVTEVMSNAAAAVLVAPIGIAIAEGLGVDPHAFMMAVAIAASTTFMTPIGHQANVLVYGVGNYRFSDFPRTGTLLNVLIFAVAMLIIPMFWPFHPA